MRLSALLTGAVVFATFASSLHAQDEARLRKALEGKRITLKMDMPATSEGVDVYPGSNRGVDFDKVGKRMKKNGVALKDGESARITKVKVKDGMIEIQLNGGGFGTFGDALGTLKNKGADSGSAQQMKFQNQRTERENAGSRFNLRYPNGVDSDDMTAAAVAQALAEYAEFPASVMAAARERSPAPGGGSGGAASASAQVHKGMSLEEVEGLAGKPIGSTSNGQLTTNKYNWQDGILEADFFNGVMVGYRTSSK
jgi:hypothetical protein